MQSIGESPVQQGGVMAVEQARRTRQTEDEDQPRGQSRERQSRTDDRERDQGNGRERQSDARGQDRGARQGERSEARNRASEENGDQRSWDGADPDLGQALQEQI